MRNSVDNRLQKGWFFFFLNPTAHIFLVCKLLMLCLRIEFRVRIIWKENEKSLRSLISHGRCSAYSWDCGSPGTASVMLSKMDRAELIACSRKTRGCSQIWMMVPILPPVLSTSSKSGRSSLQFHLGLSATISIYFLREKCCPLM